MKIQQQLFESWIQLGKEIIALCYIVQNDVSIPDVQVREWEILSDKLKREFQQLIAETLDFLEKE